MPVVLASGTEGEQWQHHAQGAFLAGLSPLMAMTGRAAALDDLSGEGLATLRSRR